MLSWLATAVLLIDPSAKRTDVTGVFDLQLRGGWAPVAQYADPTASMVFVLAPSGILDHTHRRFGSLSLTYTPRIFIRQPNQLSLKRPLIYHQLDFVVRRSLSPRWRLSSTLAGRYGELDYNAAGQGFDQGQTDIGEASVLSFANGDATVGVAGEIGSRTSLGITAAGGHRRPVAFDSPGGMGGALATAARTYGSLSLLPGYRLTPRDDLSLGVVGSVFDFDPGSLYFSTDMRGGYQRMLRPSLRVFANAGLFASRLLARQDAVVSQREVVIFPVGDIGITGRLKSRARYSVDGGGSFGTFGLFEAASGRVVYRARASTSFDVTIPPRWSAGANASITTATTREPLAAIGGRRRPESFVTFQTPIRFTIDPQKSIEFGTIVTVRAPHFLVLSRADTAYEAWGYVAFRISAGTSRARSAAAR